MRIGLAQMDITWEDKESNKIKCEELITQAASKRVDLIVFPEMTLTGFSMNIKKTAEYKEESLTMLFFKKMSRKYNMAIGFGYTQRHHEKAYNRLAIVIGGRLILDYAKIHPFSYGKETEYYSAGNELENIAIDGVNFGTFICYDLRFPEVFQASSKRSHAIIVIANWPKEREQHWRALLRARAIENQCYMIGVNRVGEGGGIEYGGCSAIVDPMGNLITTESDYEELIVGDIDPYLVEGYREDFPVRQDRREELYRQLL